MSKQIEEKNTFKKKIKKYFLIFLFITILFYFYGKYFGTTNLIINEYKIINTKIPDSFNGIKIVHFSDLHYGRTVNEEELKTIVKKINNLNPDIVFFTGDLIDKDTTVTKEMVTTITSLLTKITSTIGKYAITGNHDYKDEFYSKIMIDSGFNLLINNYDIAYYKSMTPILIGGLDNYTYKKSDIKKIMTYYDTNEELYTIILMHEPDYMKVLKEYNVDLVLAGHSHGGQIRLPFIGKLYTPSGAKKYYKNYYKIKNIDFYISSGIGCSTINVRLFNRPSINFYRIYNK